MSQTISAIANLLWPLIVLAVLVLFRGPLSRVIRSTESRDFTIKIAGQEVSVGELHRQQVDMMSDLQDQLAALEKKVTGSDLPVKAAGGATKTTATTGTTTPPSANSLTNSTTDTSGAGKTITTPQDGPVTVSAYGGKSSSTTTTTTGTGSSSTTTSGTSTTTDEETDTAVTRVRVPTQERAQLQADPVKAPWERLDISSHEPEPAKKDAGTSPSLSVVPSVSPGSSPALSSSLPAGSVGNDLVPGWTTDAPDTRPKPAGVLWVDDHPERTALQLDHLERRGIVVDVVRSTKEALQKLTGQRYQLIVSNMERVEAGKPVPNAGLELIRTVRTFDRDTPVVIYATGRGDKVLGDTAAQIGADLVTGSWFELNQEMRHIGIMK